MNNVDINAAEDFILERIKSTILSMVDSYYWDDVSDGVLRGFGFGFTGSVVDDDDDDDDDDFNSFMFMVEDVINKIDLSIRPEKDI